MPCGTARRWRECGADNPVGVACFAGAFRPSCHRQTQPPLHEVCSIEARHADRIVGSTLGGARRRLFRGGLPLSSVALQSCAVLPAQLWRATLRYVPPRPPPTVRTGVSASHLPPCACRPVKWRRRDAPEGTTRRRESSNELSYFRSNAALTACAGRASRVFVRFIR